MIFHHYHKQQHGKMVVLFFFFYTTQTIFVLWNIYLFVCLFLVCPDLSLFWQQKEIPSYCGEH